MNQKLLELLHPAAAQLLGVDDRRKPTPSGPAQVVPKIQDEVKDQSRLSQNPVGLALSDFEERFNGR